MSIYRLTGSRELNVKAVVAALNQEKALVAAFSVITNRRMELFQALVNIAVRLLAEVADNRLKVSETVVTEPRVINNSGNCLEIYRHGKIRFAKNIPELRN